MRAIYNYLVLILLILYSLSGSCQEYKDLQITTDIHYGLALPLFDMKDRFGEFFDLGVGLSFISSANLVISANYRFLFGGQVKEDVLKPFRNTNGGIISSNLVPTFPLLKLRGHQWNIQFGKWLKFGEDGDRGFLFQVGPGYLRHKIIIQDVATPIPQLRNPYRKGYDRLSSGFGISSSIAYQYISSNRQISFFVKIVGDYFWTKNQRKFNLDTFEIDEDLKHDGSIGIQAGWIFPVVY